MRIAIFCLLAMSLKAYPREYRDPLKEFYFEFDEEKWQIVPPRTGEKTDIDKQFAEQTLVNVQRIKSDDKYHSRFSVVLEKADGGEGPLDARLTKYGEKARDFLEKQRFYVFSGKLVTFSGIKAFDIIANQRDFGLMFHQRVLLRGKDAYLLTAATRTKKFEEQEAEVDKMLDSFRFYGKSVAR